MNFYAHMIPNVAGPFMCSTAGTLAIKYHILVVLDYFTKVAEFVPITSKEAVVVAQHFYNQWVCRYGVPSLLTSDNGTEFAAEFAHMLARLGALSTFIHLLHTLLPTVLQSVLCNQ